MEKLRTNDDGNIKDENKKELSRTELKEITNKLINDLFSGNIDFNNNYDNLKNKIDESIEQAAEIITHLNQSQQSQVLSSLSNFTYPEENEEIYNKLTKTVDIYNKMKKFARASFIQKSNINKESDIKKDELSEKEEEKKVIKEEFIKEDKKEDKEEEKKVIKEEFIKEDKKKTKKKKKKKRKK